MEREFGKAVIWDMDGVIADTAAFHFKSWKSLVESRGKSYSEEDFRHGFGLRNDAILTQLFGEMSWETIEYLSKKKEQIFRASIKGKLKLLPGVENLLDILHQEHFVIGLASSAPSANMELMLQLLGINHRFNCFISAGDVTKGKPDSEVFLATAQRLKVNPNRSIVIEDAIAGIEAARAAGMKCIAVTNSHPEEAFFNADVVTDDLNNISAEVLYGLLSES